MMKNIILKLKSKLFKSIIYWSIIVLFGLSIFSIPTFSFLPKYYYLTWGLTIFLLALAVLYILLFKNIFIDLINASLFAFLVSAFLGYAFNGFKGFTGTVFLNTILIIVFYMLTVDECKMKSKLYFSIICGIGGFSIIYFITYRDLLLSLNFTRLGEMFGDINDIAIVLSIGFCLSFSMIFKKCQKWYIVCFLIFITLIFLFLSFSTGSKIVIFIDATVVILNIITIFGKKRWYYSILILASVLIISIVVLSLPPFKTLKDRFLNMFYTLFGVKYKNLNYDLSTAIRLDMFFDGFSMFLRKPLFGYGPSGFMEFSSYSGAWSHNHISESFCNYGLIGTILYHYPLYLYFLNKENNINSRVENSLVCCFVVSMLSVALFGEKFFTYLFGIVLSSINIEPLFKIYLFKETLNENC